MSFPKDGATYTYHVHFSVRGALNWPESHLEDFIDTESGRNLTVNEAKEYLRNELKKGHELLPLSGECDNFDYSDKGCLGHQIKKADHD